MNYQTRKYYITVDSLQRDLEIYPSPANFQVRFEQPDEVVEVPSYLNANGVVIYKQAVVYQNVGGKGAKLENIYENIVELKCLDAQIPLDTIYVGGSPLTILMVLKLMRTSWSPISSRRIHMAQYIKIIMELMWMFWMSHIILVVDEIDGAYDGTSFASRRALAKLNYDKLYGVTKKFVGLKTVSYEERHFTRRHSQNYRR